MIRRPPRSTLSSSSAASDVYKRQVSTQSTGNKGKDPMSTSTPPRSPTHAEVLRMSAETAEKIDWLHQSHDSIKNIERSRTLDVHGAAAEGREEDMELVIECAPWRLDERDTSGLAPLMHAASQGRAQVVAQLIAANANLETTDTIDGSTALMLAAEGGHCGIVGALIEAKANLDAVDEEGWTALKLAVDLGLDNIVDLLIEAGGGQKLGGG
eukprot:TRINITY_DN1213_c0_g1_i7.p1 TRINITY_DN1213_c0_g1~~TRINITY_DN1213_c0_g1_i7.p1  ORF type:complete len:212 (+),score=46.54 TRINITY_DN1213_c0_g1_i7:79-714(+)